MPVLPLPRGMPNDGAGKVRLRSKCKGTGERIARLSDLVGKGLGVYQGMKTFAGRNTTVS
jgi:hypothetical protein